MCREGLVTYSEEREIFFASNWSQGAERKKNESLLKKRTFHLALHLVCAKKEREREREEKGTFWDDEDRRDVCSKLREFLFDVVFLGKRMRIVEKNMAWKWRNDKSREVKFGVEESVENTCNKKGRTTCVSRRKLSLIALLQDFFSLLKGRITYLYRGLRMKTRKARIPMTRCLSRSENTSFYSPACCTRHLMYESETLPMRESSNSCSISVSGWLFVCVYVCEQKYRRKREDDWDGDGGVGREAEGCFWGRVKKKWEEWDKRGGCGGYGLKRAYRRRQPEIQHLRSSLFLLLSLHLSLVETARAICPVGGYTGVYSTCCSCTYLAAGVAGYMREEQNPESWLPVSGDSVDPAKTHTVPLMFFTVWFHTDTKYTFVCPSCASWKSRVNFYLLLDTTLQIVMAGYSFPFKISSQRAV